MQWAHLKLPSCHFTINLMHQLKFHASSHLCALCHDIYCCFSPLCVNCFFSINDDVETDELFGYPSEEFAQYQATECACKYSLTWTIVTGSHLLRFFPLSILLALLYDACVSIPSHVILQPWYSLTSTPITMLLVGLCVLLAFLVSFELKSVVFYLLTC